MLLDRHKNLLMTVYRSLKEQTVILPTATPELFYNVKKRECRTLERGIPEFAYMKTYARNQEFY